MPSRTMLSVGERSLYSQLHQLLNQPGLVRGNLVVMRRRCGKPTCHCRQGRAQLHRSLYLAVSREGKRRMIYIPEQWEARVQEWCSRYAQIRELMEALTRSFQKRLEDRQE